MSGSNTANPTGEKQPPGGPAAGKPAHECGDSGKYGRMTRKKSATDANGDQFERDHVPSCGAMNAYAESADPRVARDKSPAGDGPFRKCVTSAIKRHGFAIAIPKSMHRDHSRTCGARNDAKQMSGDGKDLAAACKKDTDKLSSAMKGHKCKEAYDKAAAEAKEKTAGLEDRIKGYIKKCKKKNKAHYGSL